METKPVSQFGPKTCLFKSALACFIFTSQLSLPLKCTDKLPVMWDFVSVFLLYISIAVVLNINYFNNKLPEGNRKKNKRETNKLFVKCLCLLTKKEGTRWSPMEVRVRLCRCDASCWAPEHPPTSPVTHGDRQVRLRAHTHTQRHIHTHINYRCATVKVCVTQRLNLCYLQCWGRKKKLLTLR